MKNLIKKIILKHLACSYLVFVNKHGDNIFTFEEYVEYYDKVLKHRVNEYTPYIKTALENLKKEKKTK